MRGQLAGTKIGSIYVLEHPCMPGIVKIGMCRRSLRGRLEQLNEPTSVPGPYGCSMAVFVMDCIDLEKRLHCEFSSFRVTPAREFFKVSTSTVRRFIETLQHVDIVKGPTERPDVDAWDTECLGWLVDYFGVDTAAATTDAQVNRIKTFTAKRMTPRDRALSLLAEANAPRVFSPSSLGKWLSDRGCHNGPRVRKFFIQRWIELGFIERAAHGVYFNGRAAPRPVIDEAAPWLRNGAVVSLHRVLGRKGVLNNPTERVTCVLPHDASRSSGVVRTEAGVFVFSSMRSDLVPRDVSAWDGDSLEPYAQVPTATPEKALLDWLYLAGTSKHWALPPRHDIDFDELDEARLQRLAKRMGLEAELHAFIVGKPTQAPTRRGPRR